MMGVVQNQWAVSGCVHPSVEFSVALPPEMIPGFFILKKIEVRIPFNVGFVRRP